MGEALLPYVTAGGDVSHAEVYGLLPRSAPAHVEVVTTRQPPRRYTGRPTAPGGAIPPGVGADSVANDSVGRR
jgi:hypothetical protein